MTKSPAKNAGYFDEIGDKFDAYMSDYDVERRLFLIFSTLLDGIALDGRSILEVGCGTGRFSKQIVALGGQLMVVDIGRNLVENVCQQLECKGIVADACKLPFEDNCFDMVISSECIEHTSSPLQAIREMCRVCKPGGTVCLTTPNKLWYPVLWLSEVLKIRKFAGMENWIWPAAARKIMSEQGFGNVHLAGCHFWPFQLRFSRPLLRRLDLQSRWLYPLMINFGIKGTKTNER